MKNLLFIEGNRLRIDVSHVKVLHQMINSKGYQKFMPIEYVEMSSAKDKIGGRNLYKISVTRKDKSLGNIPTLSDFILEKTIVDVSEYDDYEGVIIDGQHRQIVSMIDPFTSAEFVYQTVQIEAGMDIIQYVSLRNSGKSWKNTDFDSSGLLTGNKFVDHILNKRQHNVGLSLIFPLYTLGLNKLNLKTIMNMQLGIVQGQNLLLTQDHLKQGDKLLKLFKDHSFLTIYTITSRFTKAIKLFYTEIDMDFVTLENVLNRIDKNIWEKYFLPEKGRSLEIKGYKDALVNVKNDLDNDKINC